MNKQVMAVRALDLIGFLERDAGNLLASVDRDCSKNGLPEEFWWSTVGKYRLMCRAILYPLAAEPPETDT